MDAQDPVAVLAAAVGARVVVRYRLDGGPMMTDVLGTLVAVEADGTVVVRSDRDQLDVRVEPGALVAGKAVPPRAVRAVDRR